MINWPHKLPFLKNKLLPLSYLYLRVQIETLNARFYWMYQCRNITHKFFIRYSLLNIVFINCVNDRHSYSVQCFTLYNFKVIKLVYFTPFKGIFYTFKGIFLTLLRVIFYPFKGIFYPFKGIF